MTQLQHDVTRLYTLWHTIGIWIYLDILSFQANVLFYVLYAYFISEINV